jgi:hypothetical protein
MSASLRKLLSCCAAAKRRDGPKGDIQGNKSLAIPDLYPALARTPSLETFSIYCGKNIIGRRGSRSYAHRSRLAKVAQLTSQSWGSQMRRMIIAAAALIAAFSFSPTKAHAVTQVIVITTPAPVPPIVTHLWVPWALMGLSRLDHPLWYSRRFSR